MKTFILIIGLLSSLTSQADQLISQQAGFMPFIERMVKQHHFKRESLITLFKGVRVREDILKAISRPAEKSKEWFEYRPIFIKESRIKGGVEFWNKNEKILQQTAQKYGVDPQIIVAIIGVETLYGQRTGRNRVIESLSTIAFAYPKRSKFFTSELEHFLLLTREEKIDPGKAKGSYAGAMGQSQFISSSYRHYAVDGDGDGQRDLWNSPRDIIASVANYFKKHGWKTGEPITSRASIQGDGYIHFLNNKLKPEADLSEMLRHGITPADDLKPQQKAKLIEFKLKNGLEYWVALHNFYVITRYNHSSMYAMAVYQLSEAIRQRRADS